MTGVFHTNALYVAQKYGYVYAINILFSKSCAIRGTEKIKLNHKRLPGREWSS